MGLNEKRFRINASQTAKGLWYFDATIEMGEDQIKIQDESDVGKIENQSLGGKLLQLIKQTEKAFTEDGKKLVGIND